MTKLDSKAINLNQKPSEEEIKYIYSAYDEMQKTLFINSVLKYFSIVTTALNFIFFISRLPIFNANSLINIIAVFGGAGVLIYLKITSKKYLKIANELKAELCELESGLAND